MGLIVDNFAGGGGASTGIEMALGRMVGNSVCPPVAAAIVQANVAREVRDVMNL